MSSITVLNHTVKQIRSHGSSIDCLFEPRCWFSFSISSSTSTVQGCLVVCEWCGKSQYTFASISQFMQQSDSTPSLQDLILDVIVQQSNIFIFMYYIMIFAKLLSLKFRKKEENIDKIIIYFSLNALSLHLRVELLYLLATCCQRMAFCQ